MESHVGRYSLLVILPIQTYQVMKYWSLLMKETDYQSQIFVLIQCKTISSYVATHIPYSRKISRAKIFEVDIPQNSSRIKFRRSTRVSLHLYAIIRFSMINFWGSSEIHKTAKFIVLEKFPLYGTYDCIINLSESMDWNF